MSATSNEQVVPEELRHIYDLIDKSNQDPSNTELQTTTLQESAQYIIQLPPGQHLFCDALVNPLASHCLILFSFPEDPDWFKMRVANCLDTCQKCIVEFHKARIELREKFAIHRDVPLDTINKVIDLMTVWESARLLPKLAEAAGLCQQAFENKQKIQLSTEIGFAISECMLAPCMFRTTPRLKELFSSIFSYLNSFDAFPKSAGTLTPGIIYLLFEGNDFEREWAIKCVAEIKTTKLVKPEEFNSCVIEEFNIHMYRIQNPVFFDTNNCVLFWRNIILLFDILEKETIEKIIKPVDISVMSKAHNLHYFNLVRVLSNNLFAFLETPLPFLLKAFEIFLIKLGSEFWTHTDGFIYTNFLDTIMGNPNFLKYLSSLRVKTQDDKAVEKAPSLGHMLFWMRALTDSLKSSHYQEACVRMGVFLLGQKLAALPSYITYSTAPVENPNNDFLYTLGCFLLSQALYMDPTIHRKQKSVELVMRRDARSAVEARCELVCKLAASGEGVKPDLKEESSVNLADKTRSTATQLISACIKYDMLVLSDNAFLLSKSKIPTLNELFPAIWQSLSRTMVVDDIPLATEIMKSLESSNGIISFSTEVDVRPISKISEKQANKNNTTPEALASGKARHNRDVASILAYLNEILSKVGDCNPEALQNMFNDASVLLSLWSCLLSAHQGTYQAVVNILYQAYDVEGRLEGTKALLNQNIVLGLTAMTTALLKLCETHFYEPCPRSIRFLMDIVTCLFDPISGLFIDADNLKKDERHSLKIFWNVSWYFLKFVYKYTLEWANQYSVFTLLNFTRDTLDISHSFIDNYKMTVEIVFKGKPDSAKELFGVVMKTLNHMLVWLRLGDLALLRSCVNLIFKAIALATELDLPFGDDVVAALANYGAQARKYNNKLNEQQRLEIISKAKEFNPTLVEKILEDSKGYRETKTAADIAAKSKAQFDASKLKGTIAKSVPVVDVKKRLNSTYNPTSLMSKGKQTTLTNWGKFESKPEPAPAPSAAAFASKAYEIARKELAAKRLGSSSTTVVDSGIAPAPPRKAGFNSKGVPSVGRSLNSLKRKKNDSSDEGSDLDVDTSDLFLSAAKKPKINVLSAYSRNSALSSFNEQRMERESMRLISKIDLKTFYKKILKWSYSGTGDYPDSQRDIYKEVKNSYDSVEDYQNTFEPLLMLECWQSIQSAKQMSQEIPFKVTMGTRTTCDGFFEVFASVKKSELLDTRLGESDLMLLAFVPTHMRVKSIDGARETLKSPLISSCLAKIKEVKNSAEHVDLVIRVVPEGPMLSYLTPRTELMGMKIMPMTTIEREYSALAGLSNYWLSRQILEGRATAPPEYDDFKIAEMMSTFDVNKSQAVAIAGTVASTGFSLIQGPPGTGKTKTILGIVSSILTGEGNNTSDIDLSNKILICAPSNAAVDELVLRLRSGIPNASGTIFSPNIVRLGRSDAINAAVRHLTLEELVDSELSASDTNNAKYDPQIRQEHNKCLDERNRLRSMLNKSPNDAEKKDLETKLRVITKRRNELGMKLDEQREKISVMNRNRDIEKRQIQTNIINSANIICSTLSGSVHDFLSSLSVQFKNVIIDEAAQCIELSSIIPLRYNCTNCIMVGDPNQLPPTVLSQAASRLKYEQSLFVRMQIMHPKSVYLLDVQYRMHPDISKFPSSEFYKSALLDGEMMAQKTKKEWHSIPNLSPYRFFDIVSAHEQNKVSKSLSNKTEAIVAMQLYEKLLELYPYEDFSGRIGIISPYKEQIRALKDIFARKYGAIILKDIDFNTVDGFQGQEKQIIIMSCVRANDKGGVGFLGDVRRMNVALTRAKSSLWILGNKDSLKRNEVWSRLIDDVSKRGLITKAYPGFMSSSGKEEKESTAENPKKKIKGKHTTFTDPVYKPELIEISKKPSKKLLSKNALISATNSEVSAAKNSSGKTEINSAVTSSAGKDNEKKKSEKDNDDADDGLFNEKQISGADPVTEGDTAPPPTSNRPKSSSIFQHSTIRPVSRPSKHMPTIYSSRKSSTDSNYNPVRREYDSGAAANGYNSIKDNRDHNYNNGYNNYSNNQNNNHNYSDGYNEDRNPNRSHSQAGRYQNENAVPDNRNQQHNDYSKTDSYNSSYHNSSSGAYDVSNIQASNSGFVPPKGPSNTSTYRTGVLPPRPTVSASNSGHLPPPNQSQTLPPKPKKKAPDIFIRRQKRSH